MAGRERGDLSDDAKCNPQNRRCSRAMFSNVDKKQCSRRSSAKPSFGGRSLADAKAAMVSVDAIAGNSRSFSESSDM